MYTTVDWADPQEEPDNETMSKVKVLYVRNLVADVTEDEVKSAFGKHGLVERVKKIKDYAFVHFEDRGQATLALLALHGSELRGVKISVSLAKPPSDRKKKEEILRNRERRVSVMMQTRAGYVLLMTEFGHGLILSFFRSLIAGMSRGPPMVMPHMPMPPPMMPQLHGGGGGGGRGGRNRGSQGAAYGHRPSLQQPYGE